MDIQKPAGLKIVNVLMVIQLVVGTFLSGAVGYLFLNGKIPPIINEITQFLLIPSSWATVSLVFLSTITIFSAGITLYAIGNPSVGSWRLSVLFLVIHLITSISIFSVIVIVIMLGDEVKKYFYQSEAEAHFYESKGPFR